MGTDTSTRGSGARRRGLALPAGVFAGALLVRLAFLAQYASWPLYDKLGPVFDSRWYLLRGKSISNGEWADRVPFYLSPLYAYVLGVLFTVFPPGLEPARYVQAVLGAASCTLVALVGRRLFGTAGGWLAGGVLALDALSVYLTSVVLPATLVLTVHALLLLALVPPGGDRPSSRRTLVAGVLVGLAATAKPNALLLLPALGLVLGLRTPRGRPGARLVPTLLLTCGAVVPILPCTLHNWAVSGELVPISTNGGRNLYKGIGPEATGTHVFLEEDEGVGLPDFMTGTVDPDESVRDSREMAAKTWAHVRAHPLRTLGLMVGKLRLAFSARELGVRDNPYFAERYSGLLRLLPYAFGLVAPIGLVGLLTGLRRRELWPLHAVAAVQVATFAVVFVLGRYRVVITACLALYAVHQLLWWRARWREGALRPLGLSLVGLVAAAALVHWPLPEHPRDAGFALQHQAVAGAHMTEGRWEAALVSLDAALASDWLGLPDLERKRYQCQVDAGRCLLELGRVDEAREVLVPLLAQLDDPANRRERRMAREVRELLRSLEGE